MSYPVYVYLRAPAAEGEVWQAYSTRAEVEQVAQGDDSWRLLTVNVEQERGLGLHRHLQNDLDAVMVEAIITRVNDGANPLQAAEEECARREEVEDALRARASETDAAAGPAT